MEFTLLAKKPTVITHRRLVNCLISSREYCKDDHYNRRCRASHWLTHSLATTIYSDYTNFIASITYCIIKAKSKLTVTSFHEIDPKPEPQVDSNLAAHKLLSFLREKITKSQRSNKNSTNLSKFHYRTAIRAKYKIILHQRSRYC